ncbi:hypothetical protein ANN_06189 [Periplaneta americana]|uniref:Transposase n=1 Tax=Periplaneta americana TaxID=6978 RepID=A0ABQ8TEQ6_PERAM|nr:hypothetical protein ANN_06189 [Periplaneta americana]
MLLSCEDVERVVALVEDGHSLRYVARVIRASLSSIHSAMQRYGELGTYDRRQGSGYGRSASARDDRFLKVQVLRDHHTTAVQSRNRLENVRNVRVSERTVRRRFAEANLLSRRPAYGPQLEPQHRKARLRFAKQYQGWTPEQWASVLFTDESRFNLRSADGRERVWRRPENKYSPIGFSSRTPFGGASVMVWAGISSVVELVFVDHGTLNAHRYIEGILQDHLMPFAPIIGQKFIIMHDNARPHTARCVIQYLQEVGIRTPDWPARSLDLNPIEYVWGMLGRNVQRRDINTLEQLRATLLEEWDLIPERLSNG